MTPHFPFQGYFMRAAMYSVRWCIIALRLIEFTGPAGQAIILNPSQVVAIREARSLEHFGDEVKCVITTADGRFFGVVQSCDEVRMRLMQDPANEGLQ